MGTVGETSRENCNPDPFFENPKTQPINQDV